jgi:hypothetical protein
MTSRFGLILAVALILFGANASSADADDVSGNWYTQEGNLIITVSKGNSDYTASIVTERKEGAVVITSSLLNFAATSKHVHFLINYTVVFGPGRSISGSNEYDLNLSDDGQRLSGTNHSINPLVQNGSNTVQQILQRKN